MNPELWREIKSIYAEAAELPESAREQLLNERCTSPEVRAEVEKLLSADTPTEFLQTPALGEGAAKIPELQKGDRIGRYEVLGLLGAGGGGRVYKAMDPNLRRQVAVKVLAAAAGAERIQRQRFLREAETASGLSHPGIITIYEFGIDRDVQFIAMEYIGGKSLRQAIPERGLKGDKLLDWAIQIADALAAAHQAGVVHRDLKPGNIMVTERGHLKVLDFGLAKPIRRGVTEGETVATRDITLTTEGMVMGTVAYMAPEQASGKAVDHRADIFSFGCVLYEMATGQDAFQGDSQIGILANVINKEPRPLRELAPSAPDGLERVIATCLRKDPAERWQSMADLRTLLVQLRQDWQAAQVEAKVERKGSRWVIPAAAAAGVVIALAGAWVYQRQMAKVPVADFRMVALTTDTGLSTTPSLSGDGRLVVYASDRGSDGNLDLWMQQIGGQAPVRLTTDVADEMDPDVSPDGTRVTFRSERAGGGVYVMPALGGEPVLVAQNGRNPRFSPDGKWIAYWAGREGGAVQPGAAKVFVVPAGGGEPMTVGGDLSVAMYPVWSPLGNKLLVMARAGNDKEMKQRPDWWVVAADGSGGSLDTGLVKFLRQPENPQVAVHFTQIWYQALRWVASPQGGGKVLYSALSGDALNLWALPLDPLKPGGAAPSSPPERLTSGTGLEMSVTSAQGDNNVQRMAFNSSVLQFDLYRIPLDVEQGSAGGNAELRRISSDLSWEFFPSLQWDGARVAYSTRRGDTYSLCIRDLAEGGRERLLLSGPKEYRSPRISGDGRSVTFTDDQWTISRVGSQGGAVERLCEKCGFPTDVSRDGEIVVFEPTDSPDDIRRYDVGAKRKSSMVAMREQLFNGEFSHDGKWVTFRAVTNGTSNAQIFVAPMGPDGKASGPEGWIAVTDAAAGHGSPHWSPEGRVMYYLSDMDGFRCVWAQKLDAASKKPVGAPVAIRHFHHVRSSLQHMRRFDDRSRLAVGPGGVVVVLGDLSGNVWMRESRAPAGK